MKKVLFVIDENKTSGASIVLEDILKRLDTDKFDIDVLILHNSGTRLNHVSNDIDVIYGTKYFSVIDFKVKNIFSTKRILTLFRKLYLLFNIKTGYIKNKIKKERKKLLDKNYDVEISFNYGMSTLFTAYGDSSKKVQWIHSSCINKLDKNVLDLFNEIVAVSNVVKENFLKICNHSSVRVIHNIVDDTKFIIKAREDYIEYSPKKLNFIAVGHLSYDKGFDRLINVFDRLNKDNLLEHTVLRIIGTGDELDNLKCLTVEKGLENNVKFLGEVKNPYPYILASDAFILSSRSEALGLVVIESQIIGTPVIAMDIPSIHEITNSDLAIIIDNNESSLYEELKKIIINQNILIKYKNALKDYKYDVKGIIKEIEDLLI